METQSLRLGEVAHLVMSFLKDERVSFPATRAAFELEARDVLKTVKPGRRGVKTLFEILDEYLQLKQECKDREDRKKCFKEDPVAAQQVERVMADMVALLDEYRLLRTVQREVEVGRANKTADQPASGLAMKAGGGPPTGATGLPQGSTPETCRKTALLNTAGLGPAAPQTAAQPTGREFVGSDTGSSADVGGELMRRGVDNGAVPVEPESEVRDTKRRKRCPVRHNRNSSTCAEASGHNDPPANTRIGGTRCVNGFEGGDQEGTQSVERDCHATPEGAQTCFAPTSSQSITGGAGTLTDKGAEEGQEPTGNVYSDISESVLCDPQVLQLLEDPTSLEDLFADAELTWLVEPLTHHINAKLTGGGDGEELDCSENANRTGGYDTGEIGSSKFSPPALVPHGTANGGVSAGHVGVSLCGDTGVSSPPGQPLLHKPSTSFGSAASVASDQTARGSKPSLPTNLDLDAFLRQLHSGQQHSERNSGDVRQSQR